ncbi:hypothetical protein V2J09_023193 [Rumex salicifolius]
MAQAVCEKPQAAMEAALNQESAIVNTALKANGDLSANGETAKAGDDVSGSKSEATSANSEKKNRIQVSNTKKPLFFYLNLAKRYIKQYNDVELSALGMAIPTVVTIAEILKANGVAVEKKVLTSTVDSKDENKGRLVQKAKIVLATSPKVHCNNPLLLNWRMQIEIVLERNQANKESEDFQSNEEAKEE